MKKNITRREALNIMAVTAAGSLVACQSNNVSTPAAEQAAVSQITEENPTNTPDPTATVQPENTAEVETAEGGNLPVVYMTKDISAAGLLAIYQKLGRPASGNVAVKISSGEPGGNYYLHPEFIELLVKEVNGTIVECNTAYPGRRSDTESHRIVIEEHGFNAIAPTDIMDAEGEMSIPITGGSHLSEDIVGSHFADYDFIINLAHFKGHAMGGLGGVIKNQSIGIASVKGKCLIHTAGASGDSPWGGEQDPFLESMAEAAKGVADYMGENIVYINVANNLSVDCDCNGNPAAPTMEDIGILASLDPVAADQACVDLVYAAPDGADLIERMESRNGIHTLEHAEAIGLGSRKYQIVDIDAV